ncbi:hypothetical protein K438DRAFT_1940576 [Mycena galopus ATCC 62051]|nr:hypothetical protein K438DRAFT_1940576 [Mycena galopus ATCC 62051]
MAMNSHFGSGPERFFLCPITVKSAGIILYTIEPCGPIIESHSTEPLAPGNYGCYFDRECMRTAFPALNFHGPIHAMHTNEGLRLTLSTRFEHSHPFPPTIRSSVVARNRHSCSFTDSQSNAILTWIVPPGIAWEALLTPLPQTGEFSSPEGFETAPFSVSANVLTMHRALVLPFRRNQFTIDVDDMYRILSLYDMDAVQPLLPTHLPPHARHDPATDHFLRLHCSHSLSLVVRGGDIREDYPNQVVQRKMDELGVPYVGCGDDDERKMVPLSDKRWGDSVLEKAILEDMIRIRIRSYEPRETFIERWNLPSGERADVSPLRSLSPASDDDSHHI